MQDEDVARIEAYLQGRAEAFDVFDRWIRGMLRTRYPGLGPEHDDLAQIVHAKLVTSLKAGGYIQGRGLRAYVSGVVHHAAIDHLRQLYRVRVLADALQREPLTSPARSPYRSAEASDESRVFHQALLSVPAGCRQLWKLLLVDELTYEEVGDKLRLPAGTIKSRMWHCRRKALAALRRLRLLARPARQGERTRS